MSTLTTTLSHTPVLLKEVIRYADPVCGEGIEAENDQGCLFLDCTLGLGGHASEILSRFPKVFLLGIDKDESTRKSVHVEMLKQFGSQFSSLGMCFSELSQLQVKATEHKDDALLSRIANDKLLFDFILADLGISSVQLDTPERGLSYHLDGPLDMRLDQSQKISADVVINTWSEQELFVAFAEGGVGTLSRPLAREIVAKRPLLSTKEFAAICLEVASRGKLARKVSAGSHPATVPFQAIRIAVNCEFSSIVSLLRDAIQLLSTGGRLGVISFHSLEDQLVARAMRWWGAVRGKGFHPEDSPLGSLLTKKAIVPGEEEILANRRSRSARLRVFERNDTPLWKERQILPQGMK